MAWQPIRPAAGFDGRTCAAAGDRDCREFPSGDGSESGNLDDSNCVLDRRRSCQKRPCRSFNRPGGNATGVSFLSTALEAKRLGLLHELLPRTTVIAALVDPNFLSTASQLKDLQDAARTLGQQIHVVEASTDSQIDSAFASLAQQRPDALIVAGVPFFTARRTRIVDLAARQLLPAMYNDREFPAAGGLISYGSSQAEAWREIGLYTGRILKGEKPANLPVVQPTRFELVINLKTAKALGLNVPSSMQVLADEVIE